MKTYGFQMDKKFPVLHCLISLAKYSVVLLHRRSANALWQDSGGSDYIICPSLKQGEMLCDNFILSFGINSPK
ncbi:MAG: hypothetical protein ABH952_09870 [Candidatus Omnitrophota bacterium]